KWGARDRRFIAETTYDIVRWFRFLKKVSGADDHDYWRLLGAWLIWKKIEIPDWGPFNDLSTKTISENLLKEYPLPIQESIPDWLHDLGSQELPLRWSNEIKSLNQEASVVLRVNTLKADKNTIRQQLQEEGIETIPDPKFTSALLLAKRMNVFGSKAFKSGLFEVQDAGSQLIAPFLRAEPGMRVIDACAGAGGKTLHLASLMENKGRIVAMDTEAWKLEELKKRARRAGANNIETKVIENSKSIKRLANSADRLLLDVPCSGLGVLKRNPDAKWKLSMDYILKVKELQQKILSEYSIMIKPGGMLVYSTCSILPSENEKQVHQFLNSNEGFELVDEKHSWPSEGFDGFYMALLRKK
ncbi:MAG TPA: RNA methyltransferase, partial [Cytophagales bacterium]|nr:RNA methyltransferase [Cytophagales bacterium]